MNIYEIDDAITSLVDPETGEIRDFDAFQDLQMQRGDKIENMALWVKDLDADAKALREEENALAERRRAAEGKAARLKQYLAQILSGEKFTTPRAAISWRKSAAVELDSEFLSWARVHAMDLLRFNDPVPDKTAIKELLKSGHPVEHAQLVETQNIQIK